MDVIGLAALILTVALWLFVAVVYFVGFRAKAVRYAVTLKNNEGSFLALCIKKRLGRWTFVDVRLTPNNPGGAVLAAAPGELYVPYRNILYYQEIQENANVAE